MASRSDLGGFQKFFIRVVVNGLALWAAAGVVDGVYFGEQGEDWTAKVVTVVLVALLFGVVNAVLKPIAMLLSLPAIVLTLGLFIFVVNAFLLQVTEWIADPLGLAFHIDHFFWDAVLAALIITLVSWVLNVILPDRYET
ncbi:MAG TPA: phage holin family protein [Dermatophilaceae bacterium]|nr:phage holin family protein [Dermatophilaceae bacterium]